jgi:hypothetical protein
MNVASPVGEGEVAIGLQVTGQDGALHLSGAPIPLTGKTVLKLLIHGGDTGGQQLRVRPMFNGQYAPVSVNLRNYGGLPLAGQWLEFTIPLSDFRKTGTTLTALRIFSGKKQKMVYLDNIRLQ